MDADNLDQPALSEYNNTLLTAFNTTLDLDTITIYDMCNKRWFNIELRLLSIKGIEHTNVYKLCRSKNREGTVKKLGALPLMSAGNRIDLGRINYSLDEPTIVKEMLIARIYIQVECFQIRGQQ